MLGLAWPAPTYQGDVPGGGRGAHVQAGLPDGAAAVQGPGKGAHRAGGGGRGGEETLTAGADKQEARQATPDTQRGPDSAVSGRSALLWSSGTLPVSAELFSRDSLWVPALDGAQPGAGLGGACGLSAHRSCPVGARAAASAEVHVSRRPGPWPHPPQQPPPGFGAGEAPYPTAQSAGRAPACWGALSSPSEPALHAGRARPPWGPQKGRDRVGPAPLASCALAGQHPKEQTSQSPPERASSQGRASLCPACRALTGPPPGTGQSACPRAGCGPPTPWSPAWTGLGRPPHLWRRGAAG